MTVGSAGACNVILKSILDPGDEIIVLMPFFPEYQFYIANHGGRDLAGIAGLGRPARGRLPGQPDRG